MRFLNKILSWLLGIIILVKLSQVSQIRTELSQLKKQQGRETPCKWIKGLQNWKLHMKLVDGVSTAKQENKLPVKSLNAVGTLLFSVTQYTSHFFVLYNPGSIITGLALWNL